MYSLPASAESLVRRPYWQSEWLALSKHLTGDVQVGAALLIESRES